MSVLREPLSVIDEATEVSDSDVRASRRVTGVFPETSQYAENPLGALPLPRGSIFSSDTSYGEPLPPGHSTFRSLGLGISFPIMYDKSLPSLPRGSAAPTVSARSDPKTRSARSSVAKSESSRHSIAKSLSPIHFAAYHDSPRGDATDLEPTSQPSAKPEPSKGAVMSEHAASVPPTPPPKSSSSASSVTSASTSSTFRSGSGYSGSSRTTLRTFDDVVDEVATELALRTKMRAETVASPAQTKIGVCATMSRTDNERFVCILATKIHQAMTLQSSYLFALIPSVIGGPLETPATLAFCGAPQELVTKASILAGLRFKTRLAELYDTAGTWVGLLDPHPIGRDNLDPYAYDEDVLWDIVRKAANPVNPVEPPPGSRSVDQLLLEARARLDRLSPGDAFREALEDGIMVDIRPEAQRAEYGSIPGAMIIERNVLEWRFDPRCTVGRLPIADRYDLRVIIYCQEGYTSSLAAAALQDIGLWRATDLDGGYARWKSEGLPTFHDDLSSVFGR